MNEETEVMYKFKLVAKFLGVSRQAAYNRMEKEKWPGLTTDEYGDLLVPSSTLKESRNLERRKLIQRVDKLDALTTQQNMYETLEAVKEEHGL
jgi:hypothetical protein